MNFPPSFGGIKERYSRTSSGHVSRVIDPIRGIACEFPSPLHYQNYLLNFLDSQVETISFGRGMPPWAQRAVQKPQRCQMYGYRDGPLVIHKIIDKFGVRPHQYCPGPGVLVEVRTPEMIGACRTALRTLEYAHRLLAMYTNLALLRETDDVHSQLGDFGPRLRIADFVDRAGVDDLEGENKIVVAILRAVASGCCVIDWGTGPLSRDTSVTAADMQPPASAFRSGIRQGGGNDNARERSVESFSTRIVQGRPHRRGDLGGWS